MGGSGGLVSELLNTKQNMYADCAALKHLLESCA